MYDNNSSKAVGNRATKQLNTTPRNRKNRREQTRAHGGDDGDDEGDTPATNAGTGARRAMAASTAKNGREIVTASFDADDGDDEDEALTATIALLSSPPTTPNTRASPPPPPVTLDAENLRGRYDRELLAILEEEQAAESAREEALAAAKARAKAAQARATYSGTTGTSQTATYNGTTAAGKASPVTGHNGDVVGGDLQRRREEDATVAAREEARLKRALARERREASERVMRVSEEYEKALEKLSFGNEATCSSSADEQACR